MAINTYKYTDNVQLSHHFKSKEFRCKCGKQHDYKIDSALIVMLEKLFTKLGASKCIISSGFRCPTHDKAVGGSGKGQHTTGKAADTCFYDKNGKPISSKLVSCAAQDLGFGGIANINKSYTYTHLDTRTGKKYMGDETKGFQTVTSDFYRYYGITKAEETNGTATVKAWQQAALKDGYKLPSGADGIWGAECVAVATKAICKRYRVFYKNKNLVRIIQAAVDKSIVIDGKFGKDTEAAVKRYQKQHGLKADGIVGINTWKEILNI